MNIKISFCFFFCFSGLLLCQQVTKKHGLSVRKNLREFSGIERLNDSLFVAHNDGGNPPVLYFIDKNKKIIHQTYIKNAQNVDWEDVTIDDSMRIYVGDIGNNQNSRTDLCIYVIDAKEIWGKDTLVPKKISFSYQHQNAFPPKDKKMWHYDAEALTYYEGKLWIFTKSHAKPYDGLSLVYSLTINDSIQTAKFEQKLNFKSRSFRKDAITAADAFENQLYILSYSHIYTLHQEGSFWVNSCFRRFWLPAQRESLCVYKDGFFVGNEQIKWFSPAKLRKIKVGSKKRN